MNRVFNFNAGPSTLPISVLERAREELLEYRGQGMSLLEMSHRSKVYDELHRKAQSLTRSLLGCSEQDHVLFLGGGATLQFSMVPFNLLSRGQSCDFTVSGVWAQKALSDARKIGKTKVIFDGERDGFSTIPDPSSLKLKLNPDAAYLHLTSNETIGGIQWRSFPDTGKIPIVADMSSDIMSRTIPTKRFGIIYAGAQKNLGPAGVTLVIIREDILESCPTDLPAYLGFRTHAAKNSLYNTPPAFAVYMLKLGLEWLVSQGGVEAAERRGEERFNIINHAIESSGGFYRSPIHPDHRSRMNVVFRLSTPSLETQFVKEAEEIGLHGLKGHRSVGGCRASLYNAMPKAGAEALAGFMQDFCARRG